MSRNGRNANEILAEIDRTRSDLDLTLDAIERRLAPNQLVDQGFEYLRHSGGREFVSNLGGAVKANPLPVVLVGLGVAWLMFANRTDSSGAGARSLEEFGADTKNSEEWASGTASSVKDRLARGAEAAREKAGATAEGARDRWNRASATTRYQMRRARAGYEHVLREQPLALGALGLAFGALLAAAAPRTRKEDELMGAAASRFKQGLSDTGEEGLEKARSVVSAATDAASREAAAHQSSADAASPPREWPDAPGAHSQ